MQPGGRVELNLGLSPATNGSLPRMSFQLKAMMDEPTTTVSQEQITVFYDGRVYVFDVVELQVRATILFAIREMEEGVTSERTSREAMPLALQSRVFGTSGGSVKKSLHAFLQNRRTT